MKKTQISSMKKTSISNANNLRDTLIHIFPKLPSASTEDVVDEADCYLPNADVTITSLLNYPPLTEAFLKYNSHLCPAVERLQLRWANIGPTMKKVRHNVSETCLLTF